MAEKELKQAPYASTLMGCIKGVSDYFNLGYSQAMLYGLSGHAFLINIHEKVCPSGPYVWNHKPFFDLLTPLGIKSIQSTMYAPQVSPEQIAEEDKILTDHMDKNHVCMVTCLEHQIIKSYNADSFQLITPWEDDVPSQISELNRKNWTECLGEPGFAIFNYFTTEKPEKNLPAAVHRAIKFALSLYKDPQKYQMDKYKIGLGAYEQWIGALQKDKADEHGHWWNGSVWAESRKMAADFFEELKNSPGGLNKTTLDSLIKAYRVISARLDEAKEKDMDREKKIILLTEALEMEYEAEYLMGKLIH